MEEALEKYREWHEFMSGALIVHKGLDQDSFIAGYAAGKTSGMVAAVAKIKSMIKQPPADQDATQQHSQ